MYVLYVTEIKYETNYEHKVASAYNTIKYVNILTILDSYMRKDIYIWTHT